MGDARGALGAKATLAWAHAQAYLATHVVELALGQGVHDVFEHGSRGHLALADDLLVGGGNVARFNVVEAVADRVEALFLGGRNGLVGGLAGALLTHLLAHDVDDALGHQAVGGELATRDGEHAVDAVARVVVDDAHAARHMAGVGRGHARVLDEGARAGPGVHGTGLAEAGDHGLAGVEHLLDLVGGDGQAIRVVGLEVGRADDAHGVVGHEDVTVGGPHAAVQDRLAQSVVHGDHNACARDDVDAVTIRHGGDLSGPGAAAVQDKAAFNAHVLAAAFIVDDDGADTLALTFDGGDAVVGQYLRPVCLCGANRSPGHLPAINRSVLDLEGALDARVQAGFATQRLGDGDFGGGHLCSRCTGQELIRVLFIVLGGHNKEASGGLDGVGVDPLDDLVVFGALGGRLRIGRTVSAARVEQTVEATGGSLSDVRPVDEDG